MRRTMVVVASVVAAAVLTAATPALRGGWAILTVHDLPDAVTAGAATTLTFSLRQHGEQMLAGRAPVVILRSGGWLGERPRVTAERTREPGVYRATFTAPEGEKLFVRVDADFNGWTVDLWPIAVRTVQASTVTTVANADIAPAAHERGRALYIAKGCVGCHTKQDDAELEDYPSIRVGPDLGGRSFPLDFLVQKMTDAASLRPVQPRFGARIAVMPQLEVSAEEARAIAGYLNARSVASRD